MVFLSGVEFVGSIDHCFMEEVNCSIFNRSQVFANYLLFCLRLLLRTTTGTEALLMDFLTHLEACYRTLAVMLAHLNQRGSSLLF